MNCLPSVESYYKSMSGQGQSDAGFNAGSKDYDAANVITSGTIACLADNPDNSFGSGNKLGLAKMKIFMRPQRIEVIQKPLIQIKQTFDGIFAGTYGGGVGEIVVSGITRLWSNFTPGHNPVNSELDMIEVVMKLLANSKGSVFYFIDRFRARQYGVVPHKFNSVKATGGQNNVETYTMSFYCASFGQKFRHISTAGQQMVRGGTPSAHFQSRNVI